jgi:hypothetical protein
MKRLLTLVAFIFIAHNSNAFAFGRCIAPIKPIPSIKPIWCSGAWVQQLRCDQSCNCYWEEVCRE